eukprot:6311278-Amphidinium_carterae.1
MAEYLAAVLVGRGGSLEVLLQLEELELQILWGGPFGGGWIRRPGSWLRCRLAPEASDHSCHASVIQYHVCMTLVIVRALPPMDKRLLVVAVLGALAKHDLRPV